MTPPTPGHPQSASRRCLQPRAERLTRATRLSARTRIVIAALIFAACFEAAYHYWLSPTFDYFGFHYKSIGLGRHIVAMFLATTPAWWLPLQTKRPSQFLYFSLYATVYMPSVMMAFFSPFPITNIFQLCVTLLTGMLIIQLGVALPRVTITGARVRFRVLAAAALSLTFLCDGYVVVVARDVLRFVPFSEVYDLRLAGVLLGNALPTYAMMTAAGALHPALIAYGLARRRWLPFLAGASGDLLIYMATGLKGVLLSPLVAVGVWFLLADGGLFIPRCMRFIAGVFAVIAAAAATVGIAYGSAQFTAASVFLFRTFGIPGLLTLQYDDFFSSHPHTLFSHLRGVSMFVDYPYGRAIQQEVAFAYFQNFSLTSNAHFWAQDGIASLGLPGILVVSVIFAALLWLIDALSARLDSRFCTVALLSTAANLANMSLFTTLLSGGLALLLLGFWIMPPNESVSRPKAVPRWKIPYA